MPQRFRFGYQVSTGTELNVVEAGRRVEAAGFDIFLVSDHVDLADRHVRAQLRHAQPGATRVGSNGGTLLRHAARHTNIIGLQGLGRTLEDGHRYTMQWTTEYLDDQIDFIRAEASGREIELNALVQVVVITDDAQTAEDDLVERVDSLTRDALRSDQSVTATPTTPGVRSRGTACRPGCRTRSKSDSQCHQGIPGTHLRRLSVPACPPAPVPGRHRGCGSGTTRCSTPGSSR